jgi:hypothetical protein
MPKGEIVGMFTGRMCLSLMERTTSEPNLESAEDEKYQKR